MPEVAAVLQACLTIALAIVARVPFLATALSKVPNGFTVVPDTRTARERKMRDGEVKGGPCSAYLAPQSKGKVGSEAGRYFALNGARVIHVDPRLAADPIRAVATILEAMTRAILPDDFRANAAGKMTRHANKLLPYAKGTALSLVAWPDDKVPAYAFLPGSEPLAYATALLKTENVKPVKVLWQAETTQGAEPQRMRVFKCDGPDHGPRVYRAAGDSASDFRPGGDLHTCHIRVRPVTPDDHGLCAKPLIEVTAKSSDPAIPAGLTFASVQSDPAPAKVAGK